MLEGDIVGVRGLCAATSFMPEHLLRHLLVCDRQLNFHCWVHASAASPQAVGTIELSSPVSFTQLGTGWQHGGGPKGADELSLQHSRVRVQHAGRGALKMALHSCSLLVTACRRMGPLKLSWPALCRMGLMMTRDDNGMQDMSSACIARGGPAVKVAHESNHRSPKIHFVPHICKRGSCPHSNALRQDFVKAIHRPKGPCMHVRRPHEDLKEATHLQPAAPALGGAQMPPQYAL